MSSRGEALATAEDGSGQVDAPGARPADAATIRLAIDGMHCANCAANMEHDISELPGVNKATISFMTSKLMIDTDADMDEVLDAAQKICTSYEKDCRILR